MFPNDKSIETLQQLFTEIKKYLVLQKRYAQLEIAEKLTILLSTLILVLVIIILSMVALFYLSFTFAYLLAHLLGSIIISFALITCVILILIIAVYSLRKKLIVNPMAKFIANLFIEDSVKEEEQHGQ